MARKGGQLVSSSSLVPSAIFLPRSIKMILSASSMVERRWAITIWVIDPRKLFKAFWISFSLIASSALVASSKMSMGAFLKMARAMASLCCCPPERFFPLQLKVCRTFEEEG